MGKCYEHLSYVERLSIDEGRRAGAHARKERAKAWR